MSDIQGDIENKAEEASKDTDDQHFGDAMDDADPKSAGNVTGDGELEAEDQGDTTRHDSGNALDDVDLEPPSS